MKIRKAQKRDLEEISQLFFEIYDRITEREIEINIEAPGFEDAFQLFIEKYE